MMQPGIFATVTLSFILTAAGWYFWKGVAHRRWIKHLQTLGVPMPPWSWVFGHMPLLLRSTRKLPPYANVNLVMKEIALDFTDDEMYLLDLWPFDDPMLVIFNADAACRVCQEFNLPKAKKNETMTRPITGGPTLLSVNGQFWKIWRSLLNPGFSASALTERISHIIESISHYCNALREQSENGIIYLDEFTTRVTFEIIAKMVLDVDVSANYSSNVFVQAMDKIIKWHSFWDPRIILNPLRPLIQWYYGHIINSWVENILQERYQQHNLKLDTTRFSRARSVIELAIEAASNSGRAPGIPDRLDAGLIRQICHHVRLFLFVGTDSTANTIVFANYMLWKHPEVAQKLREEHDRIFGIDPSAAPAKLRGSPQLLNQCQYSLAVIKETLRLYPPAASMRLGTSGTSLVTGRGVTVPTEGLSLLISHTALHSNQRLWPRATEFLPERWLVAPDQDLYPKPGAWRAFELGQRNCIGQTLSVMVMKLALVMTARTFVIEPAYEEFDALKQKNASWMSKTLGSVIASETAGNTYNEDRVYQTEKAGAHPSEGYPCRVSLR